VLVGLFCPNTRSLLTLVRHWYTSGWHTQISGTPLSSWWPSSRTANSRHQILKSPLSGHFTLNVPLSLSLSLPPPPFPLPLSLSLSGHFTLNVPGCWRLKGSTRELRVSWLAMLNIKANNNDDNFKNKLKNNEKNQGNWEWVNFRYSTNFFLKKLEKNEKIPCELRVS
jgi:hypothetical protein